MQRMQQEPTWGAVTPGLKQAFSELKVLTEQELLAKKDEQNMRAAYVNEYYLRHAGDSADVAVLGGSANWRGAVPAPSQPAPLSSEVVFVTGPPGAHILTQGHDMFAAWFAGEATVLSHSFTPVHANLTPAWQRAQARFVGVSL